MAWHQFRDINEKSAHIVQVNLFQPFWVLNSWFVWKWSQKPKFRSENILTPESLKEVAKYYNILVHKKAHHTIKSRCSMSTTFCLIRFLTILLHLDVQCLQESDGNWSLRKEVWRYLCQVNLSLQSFPDSYLQIFICLPFTKCNLFDRPMAPNSELSRGDNRPIGESPKKFGPLGPR